ncbi:MAG: accessory factor UbiK family protein [Metallibacterium scheffleri]|jgi:BMFP domain-containing protein YqiC|uniref:accessory factor UbiK family protein n=1 Tax=Metallibacterium scheffleri TaxID=993689 RepID=UPI00239BA1FF|nr:accessory factor UbiK family protein [Metallibacterium scheffleri]MBU6403558.1 accessory factor UbiK family protein [Pseudomonadota bacterium]MCK9366596.1 accessory factor UbiK family protein [Metallibacterium scheffleri]MDE3140730.1 accessory factor UbiK family protein [Pseudomonadota bacterium]
MWDTQNIDNIAQRLAALLPPDLAQARADFTANAREVLQAGLARVNLVTREEFDVQRLLLQRTRTQLAEMEQRLAALEQLAGEHPPR